MLRAVCNRRFLYFGLFRPPLLCHCWSFSLQTLRLPRFLLTVLNLCIFSSFMTSFFYWKQKYFYWSNLSSCWRFKICLWNILQARGIDQTITNQFASQLWVIQNQSTFQDRCWRVKYGEKKLELRFITDTSKIFWTL